ncbi:Ribosome association toxin RatA [Hartmannibacter diazotrophicus]|uniref:Ribosome association toxin RatA n=1 Tax=Hartmannibacter diazotrophicus TaxID=1482074 RepID=A0A2C9D425_9HYPH|nr:type II toxin-antitoxin system RatA family toxin [Hartmannibacter diazotrophicus]SON55087.1 Ribosome association toxin RatA [Hartmannibacter diazotrophicus]
MPQFQTKHRVAHSADEMFDLVADVEQYPRFVPMCESLKVRQRKTMDDGSEVLIADMAVGYKLIRETFTSKVTLQRDKWLVLVEYIDGPFHFLENRWTFEPLGEDACNICFFISYEFKSRTLGALMGAMFDRAFRKFTDAFEARADAVYGT